jgi:putative two-component system response regulator
MNDAEKPKILLVDDEPMNLHLLKRVLADDYTPLFAKNGPEALDRAVRNGPDLILLDVMMPGMDGYAVCEQLKADARTAKIPVIFVSAMNEVQDETRGFEAGAVDYISKPVSPPLVRARIKTHLALRDQNRHLEEKVRERTAELRQTRLDIIHRLGRAAEFRDNETGFHVIRMSHCCRLLAEKAGLDDEARHVILQASPMHDVGKIGIPDRILLKPGPLEPDEWELMKRHPEFGAQIIGSHDSSLLRMAATIAMTHHEKWDGSGYPQGLAKERIPIHGRIVAVADVFDALTSERPYKKAWPVEDAFDFVRDQAGRHFDPNLAELFLSAREEVAAIRKRWSEPEGG